MGCHGNRAPAHSGRTFCTPGNRSGFRNSSRGTPRGEPGRAMPEMPPTAVTPSVATELTITHLKNHPSPPEMVTLQFTREVPIRSVTVNFFKAAPRRQLMKLPPWCTRLTHFNHSRERPFRHPPTSMIGPTVSHCPITEKLGVVYKTEDTHTGPQCDGEVSAFHLICRSIPPQPEPPGLVRQRS